MKCLEYVENGAYGRVGTQLAHIMSEIRIGWGPFYYGGVEDHSGRRAARWHYLKVVCEHEPVILASLFTDVAPAFAALCDRLAPHLWIEPCDDSVEIKGKFWREVELERFNAHALPLLETLVQWGGAHGLRKCGYWSLDIAIKVLDAWHYKAPSEPFSLPNVNYEAVYTGDLLNVPTFGFNTLRHEDIEDEWLKEVQAFNPSDEERKRSPDDVLKHHAEIDARKSAQRKRANYDPSRESRAKAKIRLLKHLDQKLEQYLDEVEVFYKENGFVRTIVKRERKGPPNMHFEWLYYRHLCDMRVLDIVELYQKRDGVELSEAVVSRETTALSSLVGVELT